MNELTGVLGVFNCQGAGTWYGLDSQNTACPEAVLAGSVSPGDVEHLEEIAGEDWTGDCAVYSYNAGNVDTNLSDTIGLLQFQVSIYVSTCRFSPKSAKERII